MPEGTGTGTVSTSNGGMAMRRLGLLLALVLATSGCAFVERADVGDDGASPAGPTDRASGLSISADGQYFLFATPAALDPADTNGRDDVYRRDLSNHVTRLVPLTDDVPGRGFTMPANAPDLVVFASTQAYTSDDTNDTQDVYVHDIAQNSFERVSIATTGELPEVLSTDLGGASADGNVVLLGLDRSDGSRSYAVRDRVARTTTDFAIDPDQTPVDLTDDGSHLLLLGNNGIPTAVLDLATMTETGPDCVMRTAAISGDGRYVVGMVEDQGTCPEGLARYDLQAQQYAALDVPLPAAQTDVAGVDDVGNVVLLHLNNGEGRYFAASFLTAATGEVTVGGVPSRQGHADAAVLSADSSIVGLVAPTGFPGVEPDQGASGVYAHNVLPVTVGTPDITSAPAGEDVHLVVRIRDSVPGIDSVDLGPGVTAQVDQLLDAGPGAQDIGIQVHVDADAPPGPRTLRLLEGRTVGFAVGACVDCFTVTPAVTPI